MKKCAILTIIALSTTTSALPAVAATSSDNATKGKGQPIQSEVSTTKLDRWKIL